MKKLALIVLVALALPPSALAKGPSAASIAGPGLPTIRIFGEEGGATPFWRLTEAAGFFELVYGPEPRPHVLPDSALGPRYTITWVVPRDGTLRQDLYPYAKPSPVTFLPRGQTVYGTPVRGGWFAGGEKLRKALARVGVPADAPAASSPPPPAREQTPPATASDESTVPLVAIVAIALALALGLLLAIRARRAHRRTLAA